MAKQIDEPRLHLQKELLAKLIYEVGRVADALEAQTDTSANGDTNQ